MNTLFSATSTTSALSKRLLAASQRASASVLAALPLVILPLGTEFGVPRTNFDANTWTLLVAGFCAFLVAALMGGIAVLGLFQRDRKRDAMYDSQWKDAASNGSTTGETAASEQEPLVSEDQWEGSESVAEMFDVDEDQREVEYEEGR
jgi:hypothetical protein